MAGGIGPISHTTWPCKWGVWIQMGRNPIIKASRRRRPFGICRSGLGAAKAGGGCGGCSCSLFQVGTNAHQPALAASEPPTSTSIVGLPCLHLEQPKRLNVEIGLLQGGSIVKQRRSAVSCARILQPSVIVSLVSAHRLLVLSRLCTDRPDKRTRRAASRCSEHTRELRYSTPNVLDVAMGSGLSGRTRRVLWFLVFTSRTSASWEVE